VDPRGGLPGVVGGKLCDAVVRGTLGENEKSGRPLRDEARNKLRDGVEEMPEKSAVERVGLDKLDPEMVLNLLGLSPGILMEPPLILVELLIDAVDEAKFVFLPVSWLRSLALKDCESLLDGPWGRPMILREESWEGVARFAGDSNEALELGRGKEDGLLTSTFR
jgi:hypothetical protein